MVLLRLRIVYSMCKNLCWKNSHLRIHLDLKIIISSLVYLVTKCNQCALDYLAY